MAGNFYPDVYVLFPAGAGGTFLTTLLIHKETGKEPLADPTGEYRLDNIHWERAGNKLFARGHVPKQAKCTIAVTSDNPRIRSYTANLCRIKRFLSTQNYFCKLHGEALMQKVRDRFGSCVDKEFAIDSKFGSRFLYYENKLSSMLGGMIQSRSLLAYKKALDPSLTLADIMQYSESTFIQNWNVTGDVTYKYEDIFFSRQLKDTVFSQYSDLIEQYTEDNIKAMENIDRLLGTSFYKSIPFDMIGKQYV